MAEDRSSYRIDIKTSAEGSEKIHEVKEALHLVKFEAEGALGPVGELIRLISNPWVFAIAGLTAAYRLWNEQLEKERENLAKNIELSREQTELFKNAHTQALLNAADAANKFAIEQKHAADNVDLLTESMKRSIEFAKEMKSLTDANIDSVDNLTKAWIDYNIETGKLTEQGASVLMREEFRKVRADKEAIEDSVAQSDIDTKSNRADSARGQARIAAGQIPGLEDQFSWLDEQQIAAEAVKKGVDAKHDELAKAAAGAQAEAQQGPSWLRKHASDLGIDVSVMGMNTPDQQQAFLNKRAKDAQTALDQNESVSRNYEADIHSIQREKASVDADIDAAKKLRDSRTELARTLDEEAADARGRLERSKAGRAANDQNADQTDALDHLTQLHKRIQGGTATAGEKAEFSGATNTGAVKDQWKTILDHLEVIKNEGPGAQRQSDLDQMLGQIVGMLERITLHPNLRNAAEFQHRLEALEQNLRNNRSTL